MNRRTNIDRRIIRFGGSSPFSPKSISGLYLWLRADLGITIATGVSSWADQSGNGDANRTVTQGTGAAQPVYTASDAGFDSKPTVSSTGTQWLASGAPSASLAQPSTIYVCGTMIGGRIIDGSTVVAGRQGILDVPNWGIYAGTVTVTSATIGTTKCVASAVFNGASSALYLNDSSSSTTSGNPGSDSLARIGVLGTHDGLGLNVAKVAEIVCYSGAHDQSTRLRIMSYMGARYGVTIT